MYSERRKSIQSRHRMRKTPRKSSSFGRKSTRKIGRRISAVSQIFAVRQVFAARQEFAAHVLSMRMIGPYIKASVVPLSRIETIPAERKSCVLQVAFASLIFEFLITFTGMGKLRESVQKMRVRKDAACRSRLYYSVSLKDCELEPYPASGRSFPFY